MSKVRSIIDQVNHQQQLGTNNNLGSKKKRTSDTSSSNRYQWVCFLFGVSSRCRHDDLVNDECLLDIIFP
jgi:hypothetical protein